MKYTSKKKIVFLSYVRGLDSFILLRNLIHETIKTFVFLLPTSVLLAACVYVITFLCISQEIQIIDFLVKKNKIFFYSEKGVFYNW